MNDKQTLDRLRSESLTNIARTEFWFKIVFVLCGFAELVGLVAVFIFMNWSDPTHRLIFAATMLVYITLALWILTLSLRNRVGEQRILKAIELLHDSDSTE